MGSADDRQSLCHEVCAILMSLILNRYPITYRAEVIERLMPAVQHGHSVAIVGLAGVGKSNLITFIKQPEVLSYYLPASQANRTHFLHLHCLPGNQPREQLFGAITQMLVALALRLQLTPPSLPASLETQQQLSLLLNFLCVDHNQRVVLVWDEFDALLRGQTSDFAEVLRSLRDDHRASGNLVYVTITHVLPQLIRQEASFKTGKFFELVKNQIYPLPAYNRADSESMLDALLRQAGQPVTDLNPVIRGNLYAMTGGHSGLLKAIFDALSPNFSLARLDGRRLVAQNGEVRGVCAKIWRHLHRDEQQALGQVVHGGVLPATAEEYLVRRGLLVRQSQAQLFSQLFAFHVAEQPVG